MRLLVTGLNGTLAPKLARLARDRGADVVGWDRAAVSPDDADAGRAYLQGLRPDAIAHLATGGEAWAGNLAAFAAERGLPFVFTSSVMVFHHEPDGPHRPHDERTARDDYGRFKIRSEDAVLAAHPGAAVARIGWQIDPDGQGNNMLGQLDAWQAREGRVEASRRWAPACSFMEDTAAGLWDLLETRAGGVQHLDANAQEAHPFDRIVLALREEFGRPWDVVAVDGYAHNQRLAGGPGIAPLSARLPRLR